MSDKKLERFGKYLLLDHLVDGGMAKICRARFLGEQANKIVAIKMVQQQFSKDPNFQKMFMDEIKVAFLLGHPNIAQTHDYGMHKDQLFTAMEYVDGKNIKEYIDKLAEKKYVFPVPIAVYVISQACIGLHYAHTLSDKLTGQSLHLVHRDISPHNIMLTYDGAVKVIDFGIAKAATNSDATQAGTIKGKLSYLAPEYLDGKELDARYDEFALGITLWEMLCSRKLFKAKNELAVLKQIQACKIPAPSTINPHVPKELDQIVLKALSKDREKRYENCDQFNRALIKFLYAYDPDFNPMDLKKFAQGVFKAEIKKDKEKFFEFGKIDIKPYLDELKRELESGIGNGGAAAAGEATPAGEFKREAVELDFGFEEKEPKALFGAKTKVSDGLEIDGQKTLQARKRPKLGATQVRVTPAAGTGIRAPGAMRTKTTGPVSDDYAKQKNSPILVFAFFFLVAAFAFFFLKLDADFDKLMAFINGDGLPKKNVKSTVAINNEPELVNPLDENRHDGKGMIRLKNYRRHDQRVFINGKYVKPSILGEIETKYANEIVLRVEESKRHSYVKKFSLSENEDSINIEIPEMPRASYGYLVTSTDCAVGKIFFSVAGEDRTENLPITLKPGIPFPMDRDEQGRNTEKTYDVYYENTRESTIQRKASFTINSEDQLVDFCESIRQFK